MIGNSAYKHTSPLANPVNDAEDIARALTTLGFQVNKGLDLNEPDMERVLSSFASSLKGAELGLFFYAGHGMQVSGQNHLVPVDAKLESAAALEFETVRLDAVQRIMENETTTNVLILDACRDNPLTRNLARALGTRSNTVGKGLAGQEAGMGTFISYSTQPGNVALDGVGGRNSPFAGALVKHLLTEGKDLASIFVRVRKDVVTATAGRQIPWEHTALMNDLFLMPASAEASTPLVSVQDQPKSSLYKDQKGSDSAALTNAETSIKIATEGAYPPFSMKGASGQLTGFDVDIARALCDEMKAKCEIVAQDWDGIIPGLEAKKYDAIVASMSITDERKQKMAFTDRYYSNYLRIAAKKGSGIKGPNDLKGKTVGAQRATFAATWSEDKLGRSSTVKLYDTQTAAYYDLEAGRLDALVSDIHPAYDWLKDKKDFEFVGDKIDIDDKVAIAVRKDDAKLQKALNEALAAIRKNGAYAKINAKYFPFDIY